MTAAMRAFCGGIQYLNWYRVLLFFLIQREFGSVWYVKIKIIIMRTSI
jgi:hypothetical protein